MSNEVPVRIEPTQAGTSPHSTWSSQPSLIAITFPSREQPDGRVYDRTTDEFAQGFTGGPLIAVLAALTKRAYHQTDRLMTPAREMSVPLSVHQPVPDRTLAVWLDSTPDLSCTDSTQAYCVDGEHQPTDLVVGGHSLILSGHVCSCRRAADRRLLAVSWHGGP
jgi:hypothetical protein